MAVTAPLLCCVLRLQHEDLQRRAMRKKHFAHTHTHTLSLSLQQSPQHPKPLKSKKKISIPLSARERTLEPIPTIRLDRIVRQRPRARPRIPHIPVRPQRRVDRRHALRVQTDARVGAVGDNMAGRLSGWLWMPHQRSKARRRGRRLRCWRTRRGAGWWCRRRGGRLWRRGGRWTWGCFRGGGGPSR